MAGNVSRLRIWGRNGVGAQTMAQMLRDEGLPAQAVDDLELAVREADIVSCATTATAPVVHGAWLQPGCHLDLVGGFRRSMREADDAAVGALAGLRRHLSRARWRKRRTSSSRSSAESSRRADVLGELAQLVTGEVPGRTSAAQITLFKSVGTAIEDLAAARLLLQNAGADGGQD